jgi:predicted nucleotide-binding protein
MSQKSVEEIIKPNLPASKAIELFKRQIAKIDGLLQKTHDDPEVKEFRNFNINLIIKTFGKPSENLNGYYNAEHPGAMYVGMSDQEWEEICRRGLLHIKKLFEGFIDQLEVFGGTENTQHTDQNIQLLSKKIFIVHGHDSQAKSDLAQILKRLEFEPIILHEKANEGMTLIEKLEKHSDVGYAFILLTPDDLGNVNGKKDEFLPRARQNVVFEFGLFVGKLGRKRVCCLYTGNVERPSDIDGLVYISFNSSINEVQLDIVKELRAAGYKVSI